MKPPTPLPKLDRSVDPYAGLHSSPAPLTPRERQLVTLRYRLALAMLVAAAAMLLFY